ncbi:MAG: hypothetical protein J1F04_02925 [Oscillospiraceae bacterium]|nr:hypothetical protein [Oscillospiraceae bacterium]
MTKVKKIVAAAVAAVSMSAVSATAFAANYNFALEFSAYENNVFTQEGQKDDSFNDPAIVRVYTGAFSNKPIYFSVWTSPDDNYGRQLTETKQVTENNKRTSLPYSSGAEQDAFGAFYLHAESSFDTNITGIWAP